MHAPPSPMQACMGTTLSLLFQSQRNFHMFLQACWLLKIVRNLQDSVTQIPKVRFTFKRIMEGQHWYQL